MTAKSYKRIKRQFKTKKAIAPAQCVDDAFIKQEGSRWDFGTSKAKRVVALENGKLLLKSFENRVSGRELVPQDAVSEEFAFSIGESNRLTSASGGWKLVGSKETTQKQGERQLDITLEQNGIQITKSYMIYPGSSIIREWIAFKNIGNAPVQIMEPTFLDFTAKIGDLPSVDFHWMTGGADFSGSWKLVTESLNAVKPIKFDSYEPYPIVNSKSADYGPKPSASNYAPWYALYNKKSKDGMFIGWDYFGHWGSCFMPEPDGTIKVELKVAGHKQTLASGDSFVTPKAFVGLFQDDLDNAGNECLDWQYRYLWDYTRDGWFPAIRMLGYWSKGTGYGKDPNYAGPELPWCGGGADQASAFRKVFRVVDLMRYVGADVYHRDWGWWDCAGDWNGPDFRATGNYLRKYGMGQLIYAFLYSVDKRSRVALEHPDWLLNNQGGSCLDMSKPEVVKFLKEQLDMFVERWGDFEWRNDSFFTAPRKGDDTPLLGQDEGFRQILRYFLDQHPLCAFQAVNGGGNYGGYDYVRYSSSLQFSDGKVGILRNYYASLLFPPDKTNDMPDIWNPHHYDKATWRGLLCINFDMTGDTWDPAKLEGIRELIDIYHYLQSKEVVGRWSRVYRPFITGDDPSMYLQRLSKDSMRGIIIPKRPAPGPVTIKPKGLLSNKTYFVSFHESRASEERKGADLMDSGIRLEKMLPGELIYLNLPLHPGSKLDTEPPTPPSEISKQPGENMGYPGVELMWKPGADNNWVSCYEIFRNSLLLDKVAKGTFYFDHSAGADLAAKYEVRTVDGAGNVSAKTATNGPERKPAQVFDDAPGQGFTYKGEWKHQTDVLPAHAGTLSCSNQKGATAELVFEGKIVLLFTKLGPDCGKAAVSIDGGAPDIIDTYSADDIWGIGIYRKELAAGRHTLRVEMPGERFVHPTYHVKNPDTIVHIDGVRIE